MSIVFTNHAKARMLKRGIAKNDVRRVLQKPDWTVKRGEKNYATKLLGKGVVEVVFVRAKTIIRVITVYWVKQ